MNLGAPLKGTSSILLCVSFAWFKDSEAQAALPMNQEEQCVFPFPSQLHLSLSQKLEEPTE